MNILSLGYYPFYDNNFDDKFTPARIIARHKESYICHKGREELIAEISGKFRYDAVKTDDFPVVGDWVGITTHIDMAIIHFIMPRQSSLARKAAGSSDSQLMLANINTAFIVQSCDRDFNLNRLDRYISIAHTGNVSPIVLLNKMDLIPEKERNQNKEIILKRHPSIPVHFTSFKNIQSIKIIESLMMPKKTYVFIGSSGVGKSTLINALFEDNLQETKSLSESTNKGKHTTTSRELFILDSGSIVIDTPGMRELGIIGDDDAINQTFSKIHLLEEKCRFSNCTHTNEPGCALQQAIANKDITTEDLKSFQKLQREKIHYQSSLLERRSKNKAFGKMVKSFKKQKETF